MLQMFADDTKISRGISNECDAKQLQSDLTTLENWSDTWQLTFNAKKCKVMHLGKKNIGYVYHLNDAMSTLHPLVVIHLEKDLGVYVDNCLAFSDHVQYVANKANRILSMIRRSYTFKEKKTIRPLYISLVRALFEYGNTIWAPLYKKDCLTIEKVQRRATKMIPHLRNIPYEERLRKLELPSMFYRRMRGDIIEAWKYIHGVYMTDCPLTRNYDTRTRGNQLKLKKQYARLSLRRNLFTNRVVDLWNHLPNDIVCAANINILKARLDLYWARFQYVQEIITIDVIKNTNY